jgi:hypothetical protein
MAGIPGSVTVTGFIAPTDTTDTYAVTDPLYGIDGLRSVADHAARNNITTPRRRAGMLVYTQNDALYWQLLPSPWSNTDSDWTQLVLGGSGTQGFPGPQGPQGFMGYQGFVGFQGAAGADSTIAGPQGFQGLAGAGTQGPTGADSTVPGPQGFQGAIGSQGAIGAASTVAGPQGNQGNQGAGTQGPTGADSTVPGPQGNQGGKGNQGNQGIPGGVFPTYVYTQSSAASTWMITHNLGKYPSVTVFDDTGVEVFGDIAYIDISSLTVAFSVSVAGTAYLN